MDIPCTWCGAPLPPAPDNGYPAGSSEGRGICAPCADTLLRDLGASFDSFMSERGPAVLVVTRDVRVVDVTPAVEDMLDKDRDSLLGHLAGEVLGCRASRRGRKGRREPSCSECAVLRVVTDTWSTGRPQVRIPATMTVTSRARPTKISFLATTAKVGDNVLLRIDSPGR